MGFELNKVDSTSPILLTCVAPGTRLISLVSTLNWMISSKSLSVSIRFLIAWESSFKLESTLGWRVVSFQNEDAL